MGCAATQGFLEANKLKLIIRSHEGPDARWKRAGMQNMDKGHSLDHVTPGPFQSAGCGPGTFAFICILLLPVDDCLSYFFLQV